MLSVISWRNVWRNKGRSLVIITAIALGIWALTFALSFMRTFVMDYVNNAIRDQYAHIQLHQEGFQTNKDIHLDIANGVEVANQIAERDDVDGVTARTIISGMTSTPKTAAGGQIFGVDPERETRVFGLQQSLVEGEYFTGIKRHPAVIGKDLAEKLGANVKSKIVLTFTDRNNNIVAGAFRVAGIFDSNSPMLNQSAVFVQREDLNRLIGGDGALIHEIAIKLKDLESLDQAHEELTGAYSGLDVQTWKELAPELELIIGQTMTSLLFLLGIIMAALGFGIVNSMLMAVLERVKELGMLMAIGMKKIRVFFMIILETVMIALVGGPIGLLLGFITIEIVQRVGLDLTDYSAGLESYGYDSIMYPSLEVHYYLLIAGSVILTAVLGAIYPAIKAIRLKPVEALAKV